MHLTIAKSDLLRALDPARLFADRDPPKPILRNALLSVVEAGEHQLLRVTASDIIQTLTVHAPCDAEELGSVALSAKALYEIASTLPEGPVELREVDTRVEVRSGRRVARIPFEEADGYPHMPEPDDLIPAVEIDASLLVTLIDRVKRCASTDFTTSQASVLLEIGEGLARAVALNASTLMGVATETYKGEHGRIAVVPFKAVKRLLPALEKHTGRVLLSLARSPDPSAADVIFSFGSVQFATKRIDRDKYPHFEELLDAELPRAFRVNPRALADVCSAGCKVLDNGEPERAKFELANGELTITVVSTSGRAYSDVIADVEHEGPATWGMNLACLSDALVPIGADVAEFQFLDNVRPFRVVVPGDDSYVAMVSQCHL